MEREALTIRLPADLARRLRLRAAETKESMNAIIERAIRRELGIPEKEAVTVTVRYYAALESHGHTDYIGVLEDGRVFWAWVPGHENIEGSDDLARWVGRYAEDPAACTADAGAEVHESVDALRRALEGAGREDLLPLTTEPVIVVGGGAGLGWREVRRATLEEAVRAILPGRPE